MKNEILKFINKRPKVKGAYGYGSGVFKQSGYTEKDKPQIDLILVVDNLKEWHNENMKLNSKDYSLTGKMYFKTKSNSKLKDITGITYLSNIEEDGKVFKYVTIEEKDLLKYLETWESFYLPGRFQKTNFPEFCFTVTVFYVLRNFCLPLSYNMGFPSGASGRELFCQCR